MLQSGIVNGHSMTELQQIVQDGLDEMREEIPSHPRYFLDQDNSCHWYIVPVANRAEWEAWCELDEDDEASWTPPAFATPINGSPTRVTFTDPEEM